MAVVAPGTSPRVTASDDLRGPRVFINGGITLSESNVLSKRSMSLLLSSLVVATGMTLAAAPNAQADTAPVAPEPATVSNDALPTVQVDGVVWSQVVIGNTVYVGGNFQTARPAGAAPGVNTTPRAYILAYDITTGVLVNSFAPSFNGQVHSLAASPDGTRLYAAGDFTNVNGTNRYRAVALNPTNGALIGSFSPGFNARVKSVVATNDTVYFGGIFTTVSGNTRTRLAAVRASNGAVLDWNASATGGGNQVATLALTPDKSKLVVGGNFTTLNGNQALGMGAVDPSTGETVQWEAANLIKNAGTKAGITSLYASDNAVYGNGYVFGSENGLPKGNLEGQFSADPSTGAINWVNACNGDTYGSYAMGGVAYSVGHAHDCRNIGGFPQTEPWSWWRAMAFTENATGVNKKETVGGYYNFEGVPSSTSLNWYPDLAAGTFTGQSQAAWSISGNNDYVVLGGEFPRVNNTGQQGLVRFARTGLAPNKSGPKLHGVNYKPTLTSPANGVVRGTIAANYDMDNENLTYRVFRQGTAEPVYTTTVKSNFYTRPTITFKDTGVTGGQTYNYRVAVTDPMGNNVTGDWTPVTVSTVDVSAYGMRVLDDSASLYWRLGEAGGTVANDFAGSNNGTISGTVTRGAQGAIVGDANTATTFAGGNTLSNVRTNTAVPGTDRFAAEAWIKTTTTSGGKILGFGNKATGNSDSYDRHVYMRNDGKLVFGVYPGSVKTVTSTKSYNDGNYHHIVANLGPNGMELYVDGERVGHDASVTSAQGYNGFWRVGGDNLNGWPNTPSTTYFAGTIDEVAIYNAPLTEAQIASHWSLSGFGPPPPNELPTATFSESANRLAVSFDAAGSTDSDGTIVSYDWDFGDGNSATGAAVAHNYAAEGTYTVVLKVTDNAGGETETSKDITVTDPNALPTAAFTSSATDLTADFDGTSSSDPDGTIASYAWDFGDGVTADTAVATHTYAEAGTYNVKLMVEDNRGGVAELTKAVTVAAPTAYMVTDDFGRSATNAWGSAVKGGAWTVSGGAAAFSVVDGVGKIATPAGHTRTAALTGVEQTSSDTTVKVSLDRPVGGSAYVGVIGRRVAANSDYRVKLRYFDNGDVNATIVRNVNGVETTLAGGKIAGLTYNSGDVLNVRLQVDGTGTTALKAKVWKSTDAEPVAWNSQATDTTAALQVAGGIGVQIYVGGPVTNVPLAVRFDDLSVLNGLGGDVLDLPVDPDPEPGVNVAPVAAFTSAVNGLSADFDATGSTDSDGTIASYAWDFGDGVTADTATASHTYAEAGTYNVKLTVTDNEGEITELTKQVTVSAPAEPTDAMVTDDFGRSATNAWGSAVKGGAWTVSGGAAAFSVVDGVGKIATPAGHTRTAALTGVEQTSSDTTVKVSLDRPVGGSAYVGVIGRRVAANSDYRVKLRYFDNGDVNATIVRNVNGVETTLAGGKIAGLTYNSGDVLNVRLQVDGTGTTALKAKVWKSTDAEPVAWNAQTTDTTAALQVAGGIGVQIYVGGPVTNVPLAVSFDDFIVHPVTN